MENVTGETSWVHLPVHNDPKMPVVDIHGYVRVYMGAIPTSSWQTNLL
jgi:hypothetical protein